MQIGIAITLHGIIKFISFIICGLTLVSGFFCIFWSIITDFELVSGREKLRLN